MPKQVTVELLGGAWDGLKQAFTLQEDIIRVPRRIANEAGEVVATTFDEYEPTNRVGFYRWNPPAVVGA